MLRLVLRANRWRLLVGGLAVIAAAIALPSDTAPRLWLAAALLALSPWLVLGREAGRRRAGWARAAAMSARGGQLAALELLPPALVVGAGAAVGGAGDPKVSLTLAAWGWAALALTDGLDRRRGEGGAAWLGWLSLSLAVWTAPLWLAPWFGRTEWAPSLASGAVGYHPAGAALAAAGLPTLQDPVFYEWTLSGVVEALPTPWLHGALFWLTLALLGTTFTVRCATRTHPRRP